MQLVAKGSHCLDGDISIHVSIRSYKLTLKATSCCESSHPSFLYCCSEADRSWRKTSSRIVGQDELWHRLTGCPTDSRASIDIYSADRTDWATLRDLGELLFTLLKSSQGFLVLYRKMSGIHSPLQRIDGALMVKHVGSHWCIDHAICSACPKLNFDHMPTEVTRIEAHLWSQGTPEDVWCDNAYMFNEDCSWKAAFAYDGNVKIYKPDRLVNMVM